jgi:hypothetical protein
VVPAGIILRKANYRADMLRSRRCREASVRIIDVEKSAYHHLSQTEIASDNPCSRQLSGTRRNMHAKWTDERSGVRVAPITATKTGKEGAWAARFGKWATLIYTARIHIGCKGIETKSSAPRFTCDYACYRQLFRHYWG